MLSKSILCIEDDELFTGVFEKIFNESIYDFYMVNSESAEKACHTFNGDLLFISLDLEQSPFYFFDIIHKFNPQVEVLFFTENDSSIYVDKITEIEHANIITRPFTKEELLFFIDKLLYKSRAFGLQNYLKKKQTIKVIHIDDSKKIREKIQEIIKLSQDWGFEFDYDYKIDIALHETIVNALYHAHGFKDKKIAGQEIKLNDDDSVMIEVGHDGNRFGISITDFRGSLSREQILASIKRIVLQEEEEKKIEQGTKATNVFKEHGRGIDILRKICEEYYYVIKKDGFTQVLIIFDKFFEKDDKSTSIRIIEI